MNFEKLPIPVGSQLKTLSCNIFLFAMIVFKTFFIQNLTYFSQSYGSSWRSSPMSDVGRFGERKDQVGRRLERVTQDSQEE